MTRDRGSGVTSTAGHMSCCDSNICTHTHTHLDSQGQSRNVNTHTDPDTYRTHTHTHTHINTHTDPDMYVVRMPSYDSNSDFILRTPCEAACRSFYTDGTGGYCSSTPTHTHVMNTTYVHVRVLKVPNCT
eukprot:GHVR01009940.1.p2 GENE.GHVR01009940.1~~GHVR01009940.1.p2  ORF type:complete len:130 (-),score=72.77 GHVR01009940.1:495-884(-)